MNGKMRAYAHLFVLHCATSCHQPGLSRGLESLIFLSLNKTWDIHELKHIAVSME